jgi:hypothetical protein
MTSRARSVAEAPTGATDSQSGFAAALRASQEYGSAAWGGGSGGGDVDVS